MFALAHSGLHAQVSVDPTPDERVCQAFVLAGVQRAARVCDVTCWSQRATCRPGGNRCGAEFSILTGCKVRSPQIQGRFQPSPRWTDAEKPRAVVAGERTVLTSSVGGT